MVVTYNLKMSRQNANYHFLKGLIIRGRKDFRKLEDANDGQKTSPETWPDLSLTTL